MLLFLHLWEIYHWNQRVCSEEKKKIIKIIKKPKGRWPVWKTSALFTSTPFSFFLIIWDLESSVAQAHLKAERLGHAWKHTCWTRFQHRVKILLQPAISVLGDAAICRLKTCVAYLDSEDLMAPCNCRWDRLKISANPVYVYTFLSGWKSLLLFLWVLSVLSLWLQSIWKTKQNNLKCQLYPEKTTVTA